MRVAVLGAGLTGTSVALELAAAGVAVDLYDRGATMLGGASRGCEGKIHLGYVYALDGSLRTAATMIRGAARFEALLGRWLDPDFFARHVSAPFVYAVPADSMLPPEAIGRHFAAVARAIEADAWPGLAGSAEWRELTAAERGAMFDPRLIAAAFETREIAVDTVALCAALSRRIDVEPLIEPRLGHTIEAVREDGRGFRVEGSGPGGRFAERYPTVVNALWEQRLLVDATLGIEADRPAVHRYKAGLRIADAGVAAAMPNVTFAIGRYGDSVGFDGSAYVSWYPAGLLAQEVGIAPSRADVELSAEARGRLVEATLAALARLMPAAAAALDPARPGWNVVGGYISAWGSTGIEDAASELHERYAVGVHSRGGYHSVDTGKLTLAPLFAAETAARILGREPAPP